MSEKSLSEVDLAALTARPFFPSPAHWEDQIIYFLMLDRFSDGRENLFRDNDGNVVSTGSTPPYDASANGNAIRTPDDAAHWRAPRPPFNPGQPPRPAIQPRH